MQKKVTLFFSILLLSIFCFTGCTQFLNSKIHTEIKINLDLSKIVKSRESRTINENLPSDLLLKVSLYNAEKFNGKIENRDKLELITDSKVEVINGTANIKLQNIPVGINAIIFADLYEKTDSENGSSEELIYAGNSSVFNVKQDNNKINIVLKKVAGDVVVPDGGNTSQIPVTVEDFILYSKVNNIENPVQNNSDSNATLTNESEYTKVAVNNVGNNSIWSYFVKPKNNNKFTEKGNYQISVDLKADKTTVVELVGARADYFFTIDDTWQTYTFETGYIENPENQQFSIALGFSSTTYIRNLKVEKINDNKDLPTLSFYITDHAIKNYLNKTNRENQIIEVSKTTDGKGYSITVNTPMSHSEATTNDSIQDVTLQLRSYTASKGMNFASFNMTSNDSSDDPLKTALEGLTPTSSNYSEKRADKEDIAKKDEQNKTQRVFFPSYKEENELEECFIDGVFSGGTQETTTVTLSDFVLKEATDDDISGAGKTYAITVGGTWSKSKTLPFSANVTSTQTNCQVIFIDDFENSEQINFGDCIRFLYGNKNNDGTFNVVNANTITLGTDLIVFVSENVSSWSALKSNIESLTGSTTTTEIFIDVDLIATEEIEISAPVKLIASQNVTISRGDSFDGNFFNVFSGGSLEIAGSENNQLTLDGRNSDNNSITAQRSLITVNGTLTLSNCTLQYNTNSASGGAVYVDGGTLNFSSGTIQNCNGYDGGAVYITNGGSFEMSGGTIKNCEASLSGGGVWMDKGSSFTMSGNSKIEYCKAQQTEGGGVFITSTSTFKISGTAIVDSGNDVYLTYDTMITIAGELTADKVATITLDSTFADDIQVLQSTSNDVILAEQVDKFTLNNEEYTIESSGKLAKKETVINLTQTKLESYFSNSDRYSLPAGEYCVTENLVLNYPIQISASGSEVKLYSNVDYTISCSSNFSTSLASTIIRLPMSSGKLSLGGGTGTLTIDGANQPLSYLVMSSSDLVLNNNCSIQNGSVSYGAVYIGAGTFYMYGGTIENNTTTGTCSGIYTIGGTTNITGGTIQNNNVNDTNNGASIYHNGGTLIVLGDTITIGTHYTKNIVNGEEQDVTSGGTPDYTVYTDYATLKNAVGAIASGVSEVFYVQGDIVSTSTTITVNGDVTILAVSEGATISRLSSFTGDSIFTVNNGGSLKLGGDASGSLVIDGGSENGVTATYPLINSSGSLEIAKNCILQNNNNTGSSKKGGAIYEYCTSGTSPTLKMSGGIIKNCQSISGGGAIYVLGGKSLQINVVFSGGEIFDNYASNNGGGLYLKYTTGEISGTKINNNYANISSGTSSGGGGIYCTNSTITMNGGEIKNNTTKAYGGGIYAGSSSTITILGGDIKENATQSTTASNNIYNYTGTVYIKENESSTEANQEVTGAYKYNIINGAATTEESTFEYVER